MLRYCLFFFLMSSVACASTITEQRPANTRCPKSVCELVRHSSEWQGKEVLVKARYVSDGAHEEVLEETQCDTGRKIVDIGRRSNTESVTAFYGERSRRCEARNATRICNTEADVEVVGEVGSMSGELVLHLKEVRSVTFHGDD